VTSVSDVADFFAKKGRGHNHAHALAAKANMPGFHILKSKRNLATALPTDITGICAFMQPSAGGPGIQDQHEVGGCEGYGHSSGVTLRSAVMGKQIPLASAVGLYQCALLIQRTPDAKGNLPALVDSGTEPTVIQQAMQTYGIASKATWGGDPPTPASIIVQPTIAQLEAAQTYLLVGMYAIQSTGEQYLVDLMTAWANGYPTTGAIAASSSTFNSYQGGILSAMDNNVDHCTLWIGGKWDGSNPSSLVGIGVNSWGDGQEGDPPWGESDAPGIVAGMYRSDSSFLLAYSEATYVLDVVPVTPSEVES
jgi:hypothetical protein